MQNKELMITLWNYCNSRCDFCYNGGYYHYPINIKDHLNNCLTLLKSDIINDYVCIRLVGGELLNHKILMVGVDPVEVDKNLAGLIAN